VSNGYHARQPLVFIEHVEIEDVVWESSGADRGMGIGDGLRRPERDGYRAYEREDGVVEVGGREPGGGHEPFYRES
jgi:hypothetical protein